MSFRSAYIDDILGAIVAGKPDREFQFINMGYWPAPKSSPERAAIFSARAGSSIAF